jgi:predicted transcriptional regulator
MVVRIQMDLPFLFSNSRSHVPIAEKKSFDFRVATATRNICIEANRGQHQLHRNGPVVIIRYYNIFSMQIIKLANNLSSASISPEWIAWKNAANHYAELMKRHTEVQKDLDELGRLLLQAFDKLREDDAMEIVSDDDVVD